MRFLGVCNVFHLNEFEARIDAREYETKGYSVRIPHLIIITRFGVAPCTCKCAACFTMFTDRDFSCISDRLRNTVRNISSSLLSITSHLASFYPTAYLGTSSAPPSLEQPHQLLKAVQSQRKHNRYYTTQQHRHYIRESGNSNASPTMEQSNSLYMINSSSILHHQPHDCYIHRSLSKQHHDHLLRPRVQPAACSIHIFWARTGAISHS